MEGGGMRHSHNTKRESSPARESLRLLRAMLASLRISNSLKTRLIVFPLG